MNLRLPLLVSVLLTLLVIAAAFHAAAEDAKLRIVVETGAYVFDPAWVRLRVRVEPDKANRGLTVAAVSDGFETSSYEQLDQDSPISRWFVFKDMPAGEYAVSAIVQRTDKGPLQARAGFTVLGKGY